MAQQDTLNDLATQELHSSPGTEHLNVYNSFGPNGEITGSYVGASPRITQVDSAGPIGSMPGTPVSPDPVDNMTDDDLMNATIVVPPGGWATDPSDWRFGDPQYMAPPGSPSYIEFPGQMMNDYQAQQASDKAENAANPTPEWAPPPLAGVPNGGNYKDRYKAWAKDHPYQASIRGTYEKWANNLGDTFRGIANLGAPAMDAFGRPILDSIDKTLTDITGEDDKQLANLGIGGPQASGNSVGPLPIANTVLQHDTGNAAPRQRAAAQQVDNQTLNEMLGDSNGDKVAANVIKGILKEDDDEDEYPYLMEGGLVTRQGYMTPQPGAMAAGGMAAPRVDEAKLVDRKPTDKPTPMGTEEEIGVADDLPRNLSEGEFVIPAHVVKHFGENFFNDLIGSVKPPKALMEKKPV